jgi:hypothetical protein
MLKPYNHGATSTIDSNIASPRSETYTGAVLEGGNRGESLQTRAEQRLNQD